MDEEELARENLLDDDDDLEFHMTFPSPGRVDEVNCNNTNNDDESASTSSSAADFVFLPNTEPEPVVFLLGWAGCDDKHLAKYSKLYEDFGCITVRYTAPAEYVLMSPEKTQPLAKKLLDLIEEMSLEDNTIFIHMFSNNGSNLYQYMSQALSKEECYSGIKKQLRGLILDSSPGRRRLGSLVKASAQIFGASSFLYRFFAPVAIALVAMFWRIIGLVLGVLGGKEDLGSDWYEFLMTKDEVRCPNLFLYSSCDELVLPEDVEEVIRMKETQGCDVTKIRFDDSPHVQHLRVHREVYVNAVRNFVSKSLNAEMSEGTRNSSHVDESKKED